MEQEIDKLLKAENVNYIVYRYLMEQGYTHSAYTFGYESQVYQQNVGQIADIPPTLLVTLIQKGLQLTELQANALESQHSNSDEFQNLSTNELLTKDIDELRKVVNNNKNQLKKKQEMDTRMEDDTKHIIELDSNIQLVNFSPKENYLLSGAQNGQVRLYDLSDGLDSHPISVRHTNNSSEYYKVKQNDKSAPEVSNMGLDVTGLDWRHDGKVFASGGYDGNIRLWTREGSLLYELQYHTNPIFCQRFNPSGSLICSGSIDKKTAIWDAETGQLKQIYENHIGTVVDLDWYNEETVATCSTDRTIMIQRVNESKPVVVMRGHLAEINMCRWSPTRALLATASCDRTAKLWSVYQSTCVQELNGHTEEVEVVTWSPTGIGSANPNQQLRLATAGHDNVIKIWDLEYAQVIYNFQLHQKFPSSLQYTPDGLYLMACEENGVHIWSTKDGQKVKTITSSSIIFQASWNFDGSTLALSTGNSIWLYPDLRM